MRTEVDGTVDESGASTFVSHKKLRIGDRVPLAEVDLLPRTWEVTEVREGLGAGNLEVFTIGVEPADVRWSGTLVCRAVGEHS